MISIRTIVVSLLAMAFAAFAIPGMAGNKTFDLTEPSERRAEDQYFLHKP